MSINVVVTGMGVVSCVGQDVDTFWNNVSNGVSGIKEHPESNYCNTVVKTKKVGHISNFKLDPVYNSRWSQKVERYVQFGLNAAKQAIDQSGLDISNLDPFRIHTVMGSCMGGYDFVKENLLRIEHGEKISPGFMSGHIVNMLSSYINMHYGIQGSGMVIAAACAGNSSLSIAAMLIETGMADVVVAGASECWINDLCIAGFESISAMSPNDTMRPFDVDRNGFAIGEGAGVLILESEEHARRRGADIICRLSGWGFSSDADHPTTPALDGLAATKAIQNTLAKARINATDIDYINAHATATQAGDPIETRTLYNVFGDKPYISATKSIHGHCIGASSLIESVISILSLTNNQVPGTVNLENIDHEKCPGNHVKQTIDTPINHVISNSFGFGGANAMVVFSKFE